jgi:hypothetical protein
MTKIDYPYTTSHRDAVRMTSVSPEWSDEERDALKDILSILGLTKFRNVHHSKTLTFRRPGMAFRITYLDPQYLMRGRHGYVAAGYSIERIA